MPLGLAMVLWIAELPAPVALPRGPGTLQLSAADLARTSRILQALPDPRATPARDFPARERSARDREAPTDLALLFGSRSRGAQVEMGALGGGRADAPGLVHIGVGLDF